MELQVQRAREAQIQTLMKAAQNNDTSGLKEKLGGLCDGDDLSWLLAACRNNSVEFMREVLRFNPVLVWWKNKEREGFIHFACETEQVEILAELLAISPGLCYQKDKRGDFPLHTASKMGKVQVIKAILKACPESLDGQLTTSKETALHLAVKNDQVDAFDVLMAETLRYKPKILHLKDSEGNNVLHLATSHKRLKIIEWLLEDNYTKRSLVRIHSMNNGGSTAWDIHSHNIIEQNDERIILLLLKAAESSSKQSISHPQPAVHPNTRVAVANKHVLSTTETLVLTFSVLVAGSTYTSIFNLDKGNHVRYEGARIGEILHHPSQLPTVFYNFVFMTIAFSISLVGIVVSISSVIREWSFCFLAMPFFGLCAFFLSYAIMMNDKMPKFWVTLTPHSVEISSFWLVWLFSQALIILLLPIIWIGVKLYYFISSKDKSTQAQ